MLGETRVRKEGMKWHNRIARIVRGDLRVFREMLLIGRGIRILEFSYGQRALASLKELCYVAWNYFLILSVNNTFLQLLFTGVFVFCCLVPNI